MARWPPASVGREHTGAAADPPLGLRRRFHQTPNRASQITLFRAQAENTSPNTINSRITKITVAMPP